MIRPSRIPSDSRLFDLARRRADELRVEALEEFWHGADAAARRARRSAQRFAASLARHTRLRAQA